MPPRAHLPQTPTAAPGASWGWRGGASEAPRRLPPRQPHRGSAACPSDPRCTRVQTHVCTRFMHTHVHTSAHVHMRPSAEHAAWLQARGHATQALALRHHRRVSEVCTRPRVCVRHGRVAVREGGTSRIPLLTGIRLASDFSLSPVMKPTSCVSRPGSPVRLVQSRVSSVSWVPPPRETEACGACRDLVRRGQSPAQPPAHLGYFL